LAINLKNKIAMGTKSFFLFCLLLCLFYANGQQKMTISGSVVNESGQPLQGATVMQTSTTNTTVTDQQGHFNLSVSSGSAILEVSYTGYVTSSIPVSNKSSLQIVLKLATSKLDEVVVIGYGTQKRTTMTGAVSTISGDELAKAPVANITKSIAGKVAGVSMRPNGGQPGQDNPSIHIRGIATTGTNSPLIVVDGILRDNINQVDPEIIESVSVLKDAAAVAPYGLGGANGVILITTKTGKIGSPTLAINSYYGVQSPTYFPDLLDAKDYMRLTDEAYLNEQPGGTNLPFSNDLINDYDALNAKDPDLYPNSSTKDLIKMNAPIQNHHLQLSGGSEKTKYFTNLGYFKQDGLFENVNYDRINYALNLESKATNTTKVSFSLLGSVEQTNDIGPGTSTTRIFRGLYKFFPTAPIYYTNGFWGLSAGNSIPAVLNSDDYQKNNGNTLLSTITLEQQLPFIKGLSIKGSFSYDLRSNFIKGWHTPWYYWNQNTNTTPYTYTKSTAGLEGGVPYTYLREEQTDRKYFTYQGYINYQRSFGKNQFTGLLVAEARNNKYNTFYAQRNNFAVDIDELDMGSSNKTDYSNGGSSSVGSQIGYIYRLGYVYNNKYMLEATGRYDGHYYFAPGKRWGYFPAFSAGWRISDEEFMENVKFIDNLKIRGSWGKSGNLAGSAYQYLSGYNLVGGVYGFGTGTMVQGAYNSQEANRNITWEISKKIDIGFEAALWNNLLMIEADYFYERRSGMLLSPAVTVPVEYGLALAQENAGEMQNHGFELRVGTQYLLQNGLKLGFDGNISVAKNKMVQVFETEATYNNPNRRVTGRPYGTPFGYHALGLFTTKDDKNGDGIINAGDGYKVVQFGELHPGDIKYEDVSGPVGVPDGKIDDNDEVVIGYYPGNPSMTFGLTLSAAWKGIDLGLFLQGSAMTSMNIANFQTVAFQNNKSNASYEYFDNHWTPDNENAKYPRATTSPSANNTQTSDFWMMNTSYLRLKTVTCGYTLPNNILKRLKIKSIRVYFSGQNLFTFSKLNFMDPETPNGSSIETVFYPNMKTLSLGANITF
jgi:TonB-linked SusC/RagA family outer membrane protein